MRPAPRPALLALVALAACGEDGLFGKNEPPVANAGPDLSVAAGNEATFDGASSRDPDGEIASFSWKFSDGGEADGNVVKHTFAQAGSFKATLTVTDADGATATDEATVTVTSPNALPVPIIGGPSEVIVNTDTVFDANDSADEDGTIVSYRWSFSDGGSGTSAAVSHKFTAVGSYKVTLTVTDDKGAEASAEHTVRVKAEPVVETPTAPASSQWTWRAKDPNNAGSGLCSIHTAPLTIRINGASCTVTEAGGALGGNTVYNGSYAAATRRFDVSHSMTLGGTEGLRAAFAADFRTFEGEYFVNGGGCNLTIPVVGTRQ